MSITADRELLRAWLVAAEAAQKGATPLPWMAANGETEGRPCCYADDEAGRATVHGNWPFKFPARSLQEDRDNIALVALAVNALPASILAIRSLLDAEHECGGSGQLIECRRCMVAIEGPCPQCAAIIAVAESLRAGGFHA